MERLSAGERGGVETPMGRTVANHRDRCVLDRLADRTPPTAEMVPATRLAAAERAERQDDRNRDDPDVRPLHTATGGVPPTIPHRYQ